MSKSRRGALNYNSKERRRIQRRLAERDGLLCSICDVLMKPVANPGDPRKTSIDHIIPVFRGGTNSISNLRLTCHKCNSEREYDTDE